MVYAGDGGCLRTLAFGGVAVRPHVPAWGEGDPGSVVSEAKTQKHENDPARRRIIRSDELFNGAAEVLIQHREDFYRLLITKAGKLILNK